MKTMQSIKKGEIETSCYMYQIPNKLKHVSKSCLNLETHAKCPLALDSE